MSLKVKNKKYYPAKMPCPECGKLNYWDRSTPIVFSLENEHKRWYKCSCGCRWTTRGLFGR